MMERGFWFSAAMGEYMAQKNGVEKMMLIVAALQYAFHGRRYERYGEFLALMDAAQEEHGMLYTERKRKKRQLTADGYRQIMDYMNRVTGRSFRVTDGFRDKVDARIREGAMVEDFYAVIDNQAAAWGRDPAMRKYLRPETLFGNKFESYRNNFPVTEQEQEAKKRDAADGGAESSFDTDAFFAAALARTYTEE